MMTRADSLSVTLSALADPTRRAILSRLSRGPASVNELARPFRMSQPAVSKHLRVLEEAGLVTRGQDAQRRPRELAAAPLQEVARWLDTYRRFWEARLNRFENALIARRKPRRTLGKEPA